MSSRSLRILTVADVPPDPNSGAAGTVYHTNVALRELGHEVEEIWEDDLGPRRIRHGNLHALLEQPRTYRREVMKAVAKRDFDVVIMSQPQAYLAARELKRRRFPGIVINRSHGVELRVDAILPEWHRNFGIPESRFPTVTSLLKSQLGKQWFQVVRFCDGIVTGCELDREYVIRTLHVDPSTVRAITHGVADTFLTPVRRNVSTGSKLLYVGQYAFIKGTELLFAIVNRTLADNPVAEFTWVCSVAHHDEVRRRIDAKVSDRFHVLDWMSQESLKSVYDEHDLFVFPSLFEGCGKAPVEAMARALCVVATDEGGMHDYIQHGRNGLLFATGDVESAVQTILRLLRTPDKLRQIGERARESAGRLSWLATAQGLAKFIRELPSNQVSCADRV